MNNTKDYELVGVMTEESFPILKQYVVAGNPISKWSDRRITPLMFKELPPGTELFIKVNAIRTDKETL